MQSTIDQAKFTELFESLLELTPGSLTPETHLADIEQWDSMAFVAFLVMADEQFGVPPPPAKVRACSTVSELFEVVSSAPAK